SASHLGELRHRKEFNPSQEDWFQTRTVYCPPIIPRCQWGAKAYRGTPIPLSLPLQFLHVHHTYEPSSPCLSFQNCSHNMRSMQRFHQEDRFWSDIGYSFVIGSDGYIYEGRGWNHLGTHTRGHNHIGYGVSIIGNYTCAVDRGGLTVVNYTSCPGDIPFLTQPSPFIQAWDWHYKYTGL
uniref:Uncharacterized protein n=1 Tax=Mola mola TaxID=94237 RepID=A0A3Q3WR71_MOLML